MKIASSVQRPQEEAKRAPRVREFYNNIAFWFLNILPCTKLLKSHCLPLSEKEGGGGLKLKNWFLYTSLLAVTDG